MNTTSTQAKLFLALGALNVALVVALDAAGAHVLKAQLMVNDPTHLFQLALQYHKLHAVGLILIGLAVTSFPAIRCFVWSGWLLCAGIVLFSGDLYLRSISGLNNVYMTIPIGGALFIFGWLLFAVGALRILPTSK